MSWFESLILGLVQGLTEFLPVSSSAHLRLTAAFSGWEDPGAAFTAITQIGTEAAVLIYFRKDIGRILSAWTRSLTDKEMRRDQDARTGWLVVVGSIPIGVLGVTLKDQIEGPFRDLRLTAAMLIGMGIVLGVADRLAARAESGGRHRVAAPRKELSDLNVRDGLIYGFCQALALIPGVSRSGATISGGLFMGYRREAAARYSFLLAIPAVLASGLFELKDAADGGHVSWGPTLFATVIAFVTGYAVIAWFMKFISTKSFMPFVWYRIALGVVILALVAAGALSPHAAGGGGGGGPGRRRRPARPARPPPGP
ncbi:undecaprenyl-diphosphate phosphatase, partial [Streptomyces sp. NPDC093594]|uniref:undecaprenyl-diphosphate phosphatase n=1 Tax=Streptomyces sp. NPDC093594 TaxID=3155305 RepID=UPI00344BD7CF